MIKTILGIIAGFIFLIILLFFETCTGCVDSIKYDRYELEEKGHGQYIIFSPEGYKYTTLENKIWYPDMEFDKGINLDEAIGKCGLGFVLKTTSEVCLFTSAYHERNQYFFFLDGTVLPELNIENTNNIVLEDSRNGYFEIDVDKHNGEKLLELYHNTEIHEILNLGIDFEIMEVIFESEQYKGLYFSRPIYKNGTQYYLYITYEYDSGEDKTNYYYVECTSIIENILGNN